MDETARTKNLLAGLLGGIAGGIAGYCAFIWIARQGYYALMLPGGLAGLGAGLFVKDRSVPRGVLCGIFALGLGLFAEWHFAPFIKDPSFAYFLAHVGQLQPVTMLMIVGGGVLGYWLALGKERGAARPKGPTSGAEADKDAT